MCVSMCVCFDDNLEGYSSKNMKFEHIEVYENNSDKFENGHCRIRSWKPKASVRKACYCKSLHQREHGKSNVIVCVCVCVCVCVQTS